MCSTPIPLPSPAATNGGFLQTKMMIAHPFSPVNGAAFPHAKKTPFLQAEEAGCDSYPKSSFFNE
jgi:hypothetical protein